MTIQLRALIAAAFIVAAASSVASARPMTLLGHAPPRPPAPTHRVTYADVLRAQSGGWRQVEASAPFGQNGAGTELLMTDGSVMVQDNAANWYRLIPNVNGNYIEGHWQQAATLPSGYGPLYFGSAVLADGKLVIDGGEYNFFNPAEINMGAIYDPVADAWTSLPRLPWSEVGDASSVVLPDGTFMLGNCCNSTQALLNESTLTWSLTGAGKADGNSEEGWTLLPSGKVVTADVGDEPNSELYNPRRGSWSSAGSLPGDLTLAFEIGPQILRPNGTVFVIGANGNTATYQTLRHAWIAGPALPAVNGQPMHDTDGPATLLTNGTILFAASPGTYQSPMYMFVYNGRGYIQVAAPPDAPNDSSYNVRLLMLPTGQVLETDGTDDVEIYTPRVHPDLSSAPSITSVPTTLTHGSTYTIAGTLFNGISQANAYGDDDQQASNYPLVRIQNSTTGHVFYARTHDHSFMGVASMATVTTMFDVPAGIELGASTIVVIANGIPSQPVAVTVN